MSIKHIRDCKDMLNSWPENFQQELKTIITNLIQWMEVCFVYGLFLVVVTNDQQKILSKVRSSKLDIECETDAYKPFFCSVCLVVEYQNNGM